MVEQRGNAVRSAVVVLGSLAFAYLTVQVAFKPYLERAQEAMAVSDGIGNPTATSEPASSNGFSFREDGDVWKEDR